MQNHPESPGERAIKAELRHLNINFIQEYKLPKLKGDTKAFRVADFYLPDHDVYIEFLGGWNTGGEEKKRYGHKWHVYEDNEIKCIWIYPNQLHYVSSVIKKGLEKYASTKNSKPPYAKPENSNSDPTYYESDDLETNSSESPQSDTETLPPSKSGPIVIISKPSDYHKFSKRQFIIEFSFFIVFSFILIAIFTNSVVIDPFSKLNCDMSYSKINEILGKPSQTAIVEFDLKTGKEIGPTHAVYNLTSEVITITLARDNANNQLFLMEAKKYNSEGLVVDELKGCHFKQPPNP